MLPDDVEIKTLVSKGADINVISDFKKITLHYAAKKLASPKVLKLLYYRVLA
nr:ankyrin repeat protein [Oriental turtle dovepox virus]